VILSRVLSGWTAADGKNKLGVDAAVVILAGLAENRQKFRDMLQRAEECIRADADKPPPQTSFNYAVPELLAAFTRAISEAEAEEEEVELEEVEGRGGGWDYSRDLALLFQVLFMPTGGFAGMSFPLRLLSEVRSHGPSYQSLAVQLLLQRLRERHERSPARAWALAERSWHFVNWTEVTQVEGILLIREWLTHAKSCSSNRLSNGYEALDRSSIKQTATRLLTELPLEDLDDPIEVLGPPVPSHVLASLAARGVTEVRATMNQLRMDNARLQAEISRLQMEMRRSS